MMAAGTVLGMATMIAISTGVASFAAITDGEATAEKVFAVSAAYVAAKDMATSEAASVVVSPMAEADTEAEAARTVAPTAEAVRTVEAPTAEVAGPTAEAGLTAEGTDKVWPN